VDEVPQRTPEMSLTIPGVRAAGRRRGLGASTLGPRSPAADARARDVIVEPTAAEEIMAKRSRARGPRGDSARASTPATSPRNAPSSPSTASGTSPSHGCRARPRSRRSTPRPGAAPGGRGSGHCYKRTLDGLRLGTRGPVEAGASTNPERETARPSRRPAQSLGQRPACRGTGRGAVRLSLSAARSTAAILGCEAGRGSGTTRAGAAPPAEAWGRGTGGGPISSRRATGSGSDQGPRAPGRRSQLGGSLAQEPWPDLDLARVGRPSGLRRRFGRLQVSLLVPPGGAARCRLAEAAPPSRMTRDVWRTHVGQSAAVGQNRSPFR
jgi:hypothetical protein